MPDRFYIGPIDQDSGLQTNYKPFVIPDKAFAQLQNAYVFRGRVRKRFGEEWLGNSQQSTRLRVKIGTTDALGDFNGFVPLTGGVPIVTVAVGQVFSIGDSMFTVNVVGAPANLLRDDGGAVGPNATFNSATGNVVINTNVAGVTPQPLTDVYYYPALPVMGLLAQETSSINNEPTIAFDTKFAYQYTSGGWDRISAEAVAGAAFWTGSNSQFFWPANYSGASPSDYVFFVTNFNQNEALFMRYLLAGTWNSFRPKISNLVVGPPVVQDIFLDSARLIIPFKNRLVMLNTWESSSNDGVTYTQANYPNRARYCQIGSPLDATAWRQDIPGKGSGIDAPTREQIITAEFVKDRLIVYFERSTWELVYTGNQAYPFVWQQINTELGAESTFSVVPFDKVALGVGNVGIHACNGANTERIDAKIPQVVFNIHNKDSGVDRVYGIRDYYVEMVYWTFPAEALTVDASQPYPNRVLIYNYTNNTWAFNDDSITCFGYFQNQNAVSWDSSTVTWDDDDSWSGTSTQGLFRNVIAGNQEGWTFLVRPDDTTNCPALQVTDITGGPASFTFTSIDHNLREGEYVLIENITDTGDLNLFNGTIQQVVSPITANTFTVINPAITGGTYLGGAFLTRVPNIQILTKAYNFYAQQGRNAFVSRVDFLVDRTDLGEIQVDYYVSTSTESLVTAAQASGSLIGTSVLETTSYAGVDFEETQAQLWHALYFTADGEYIQLFFNFDDEQMRSIDVWQSDFQLHAMIIHAQPSSMRLQ